MLYCTRPLRVLYQAKLRPCTSSVGAQYSAGKCFILLYTVYILHTYVLQLIINNAMYTIVPVCGLYSNFGNINAVYMHFYPD